MGDPAGGWYPARVRALPFQISVAAHLPHAVGLAWGLAHQGLDGVVLAFLGDGGTSEGDFAEACNLAGVLRAPVVFVVSNNGWAISTPYRQQTAAVRLADRAVGFGFDGVVVDGNDMLAVYAVVRAAVERCRQGGGPTLVEALTYRCGPHSTVDDPSRYRDDDEVAAWSRLDPLRRLESHAVGRGIWSAAATEDEFAVARRRVDEAFALAQSMHQPSPAQLFDHVYAAPSARMAAQLAALGRSTTGQPPGRQPGRQR
jgi:pyruvate dehydrogenase E1 component alpha subunit